MSECQQFEVAGHTDVGAVRKANEDSLDWYLSPDKDVALAVVADGMGGHAGGAKASQTAIEVFVSTLAPSLSGKKCLTTDQVEQGMYQAGVQAHNAVQTAKTENPEFMKMGTTIVSLWVQGGVASVLHVGDSRCYRIRAAECGSKVEIQQLTRDDSVVQAMIEEGTLDEDEAEYSPYRNMLTQAVGSDGDILINQLETDVQSGDLFLLCSDGLYNELSNREVIRYLRHHEVFDFSKPLANGNLSKAAFNLVEAAVSSGGHDNVSAVLIRAA